MHVHVDASCVKYKSLESDRSNRGPLPVTRAKEPITMTPADHALPVPATAIGARSWVLLLVLSGVDLPRGRRHLDDGRRAAVDPRRARDVDDLAAVGRERLRPRLRRLRAARRAGRRPRRPPAVFLSALAVFVAFSGVGGLAQEGWVLVLARFVTGLGAGVHDPGRAVDHHDDASPRAGSATARCSSTPASRRAASRSGSCSAGC